MLRERRIYPRIAVAGQVSLFISGVSRSGKLLNLSPSGVELECQYQLIERMSQYKRGAGLYPDVDLEFSLPISREDQLSVRSSCNVCVCRRLSQDTYHLRLNFISLTGVHEKNVSDFIDHTSCAMSVSDA
jgi:hypothetical protein